MSISELLINGLIETGISQKELSEKSLVSKVTISKIVNGHVQSPDAMTMAQLKKAFKSYGLNWG